MARFVFQVGSKMDGCRRDTHTQTKSSNKGYVGRVDREQLERRVSMRENRYGIKFIVKSRCGGDMAVPCTVLSSTLCA